MKRKACDYIEDIIGAMDKATTFIEGMSYDEFIKDDKTVFAVIRALEIIGEAVKNVPYTAKEKYKEIPWKDMAGMRDKLTHAYFGVRLERIWETIKERVPLLKPAFEKVLKELRELEERKDEE